MIAIVYKTIKFCGFKPQNHCDNDSFAEIFTFDDFLKTGTSIYSKEVRERSEQVKPGDCASLIYTSGTTVMIISSYYSLG